MTTRCAVQMEHSTRLEAENAELRAELEAVLAAKLAAEAALATTAGERGVCAAAANVQLALAAEEADRAKEAGLRLLELADHAALVAAAYEVGTPSSFCRLLRSFSPRIPQTQHGIAWECCGVQVMSFVNTLAGPCTGCFAFRKPCRCTIQRHASSRMAHSSSRAQQMVPPPVQDEREGLRRELQATQERLAAAEAAVAAAQSATHMTTGNQLAILDRQLIAARSALSIGQRYCDTSSQCTLTGCCELAI